MAWAGRDAGVMDTPRRMEAAARVRGRAVMDHGGRNAAAGADLRNPGRHGDQHR